LGFVWNEIPRPPGETGAAFKVGWPADTGHYDAAQTWRHILGLQFA
jgi:hypothetical protein